MLWITLALNVAVVIGKLVAGLLADSLSVISDAIHSSVDSVNNVVGLVVMKYATAEPDEEHPYGHAKFETLAAFVIAGFLFVTCYQIGISAISRLWSKDHAAPEITSLTIGVIIATIVVNIFVTVYEQREGKRLNSEFLIADVFKTNDPSPLVNRIRIAISTTPMRLTASIGTACGPLRPLTALPTEQVIDAVVDLAISAMEQSRAAGGNQTTYAQYPTPSVGPNPPE